MAKKTSASAGSTRRKTTRKKASTRRTPRTRAKSPSRKRAGRSAKTEDPPGGSQEILEFEGQRNQGQGRVAHPFDRQRRPRVPAARDDEQDRASGNARRELLGHAHATPDGFANLGSRAPIPRWPRRLRQLGRSARLRALRKDPRQIRRAGLLVGIEWSHVPIASRKGNHQKQGAQSALPIHCAVRLANLRFAARRLRWFIA